MNGYYRNVINKILERTIVKLDGHLSSDEIESLKHPRSLMAYVMILYNIEDLNNVREDIAQNEKSVVNE